MALTQSQKWLAVGGLTLGAAYLGYTTLFPQTESQYAKVSSQAASHEVETLNVNEPPVDVPSSFVPLETAEQVLSEKLAAQLAPPTERTEPLVLDAKALEYLTKSRDVALAELDANLREQNARAKPSAAMTGLGLDTPMQPLQAQNQSTPSPLEAPLPVVLGSIIQLADSSYSARLHYQGRWHKVTKGFRMSDLSVVGIGGSGVHVRVSGQDYRLFSGGGYESL